MLNAVAIADRFEVKHELGRGGMGVVVLAYDHQMQRDVAIKFLPPERRDQDAIHQFGHECLVTERVQQHPNVVQLMGSGHDPAFGPYLVLEYLPHSLRDGLNRMWTLPEVIERIVKPLRAGLERCHAVGVIHRDLKPSNIRADASGRLVLCDFGISYCGETTRFVRAPERAATPKYCAPEQGRGSSWPVPLCDSHALAVIVYEALAGRHPFAGMSDAELLSEQRPDPLPLGGELDKILRRGMHPNPDLRLSLGELCDRLTALVEPGFVAVPEPPQERTTVYESTGRIIERRIRGPIRVVAQLLLATLAVALLIPLYGLLAAHSSMPEHAPQWLGRAAVAGPAWAVAFACALEALIRSGARLPRRTPVAFWLLSGTLMLGWAALVVVRHQFALPSALAPLVLIGGMLVSMLAGSSVWRRGRIISPLTVALVFVAQYAVLWGAGRSPDSLSSILTHAQWQAVPLIIATLTLAGRPLFGRRPPVVPQLSPA